MKNCIILISHSNYIIKSAGVEKYIGDVAALFLNKGIQSVHLFPIIEINKRSAKFGKEYIGVHYNKKFIGIYRENDTTNVLLYLKKKYSLNYLGVHLNHVHGWNLNDLETNLLKLRLHIKVIVHDYDMICENIIMEDGHGKICRKKMLKPCIENCIDCKYTENAVRQFQKKLNFLKNIDPLIEDIVVPSKIAGANWLNCFKNYKDRLSVREHLQFSGRYIKGEQGKKLKIAYIGSVAIHKGYNEWLKLQKSVNKTDYEFYYFGNSKQEMPGVEKVFADFHDGVSKSMTEYIREHEIDLAFVWSTRSETYCYTAYEAFAAGCYILTNCFSGNIADMVDKFSCGKVFMTLEECIAFLKDFNNVKNILLNYIITTAIPLNIFPNETIEELMFSDNDDFLPESTTGHVHRYILLTVIYYLMRERF